MTISRSVMIVLGSLVLVMASCASLFQKKRTDDEQREYELQQEIKASRELALKPTATWSQRGEFLKNLKTYVRPGYLSPTVFDEAWTLLDRTEREYAEDPKKLAAVAYWRGEVVTERASYNDALHEGHQAATKYFVASVKLDPSCEECDRPRAAFSSLAATLINPALVVELCPLVRTTVDPDDRDFFDLIDTCLSAAGQDRRKLSWATSGDDLEIYDNEVAATAGVEKMNQEQARSEARANKEARQQRIEREDAQRGDRCDRCRKGDDCKSDLDCVWTGEKDSRGQIRFCGPSHWGQHDSKNACLEGRD